MTNLKCNNCNTLQKARVIEVFKPSSLPHFSEVSRFFLLVIDKCEKCAQKKIFTTGLAYSGHYIKFNFLKTKNFAAAEAKKIQDLDNLPVIEKVSDKGGFYLNYNEHGVKKRCYSILSNIKIGLDKGWDADYASSPFKRNELITKKVGAK